MYPQSQNIYKRDIFILQLIYNFKDFKEVFWEAITEFNNSLYSPFSCEDLHKLDTIM